MKNVLILFVSLVVFVTGIDAQEKIKPNDKNIHIHGAKFVKVVDGELIMHRHSDILYKGNTKDLRFNPEKALSSTGVSIVFRTASPTVKVNLRISNKDFKKKPAGGFIGIYQEESSISKVKHTSPVKPIEPNTKYNLGYEKGKKFTLDLVSNNKGELVEYKITLPLFIDVNLLGLELEDGYKLKRIKSHKKPVYVAYGNSITHGRGQRGTNETYAFLISEWNNWELYNLAVGGGKTSPKMANMISDEFKRIDYMTVLIGFNDYAGGGESPETYTKNYTDFLNIIRNNHPNTKIYCITLTATTMAKSKKSIHIPAEFRNVVRNIVKERKAMGDKNIYLIEGEDISKTEWLKDKVHFTAPGILNVADKLYYEIEKTN